MIELDLQRSSPCGRVEPEVYAGRKISDLINLCYKLAVHSKRYKGMIRIWTETDVQKRNVARKNKLNYLVFWKYKVVYVNKKQTARLIEFDKWVSSGCPDSYDYYLENTY